jgi:arylsulfatase
LKQNTWELYNLNDDPTERIDLAKKFPEKLTQLKAEFEEQAKSHHLAPYITFDDMYQGRTHHTYLPQWYLDRQKEQAQSGNGK